MHQCLGISENDFNDFMRMKNELLVATTEFATVQGHQLRTVTIGAFAREMETQLKMAHKVYNVVDLSHRRICVTMLQYKVKISEPSYGQVQVFTPKKDFQTELILSLH